MKLLHLVMAGSLAVSAWLAIFGDKSSESVALVTPKQVTQSANPVERGGRQRAQTTTGIAHMQIAILTSRDSLIGEDTATGNAELFGGEGWMPAAPPSSDTSGLPSPLASAPLPSSFTYLGKKQEDGRWEVYLDYQGQTLIVKEHSIIEGAYRVDAIKPPKLVLTYLPLSKKQTIMIGDAN